MNMGLFEDGESLPIVSIPDIEFGYTQVRQNPFGRFDKENSEVIICL